MTDPRLLVVTPRVPRVSQAWLHSHAAALGNTVAMTATYEKSVEPWVEGKPNVSLGHPLALDKYGLARTFRLRTDRLPDVTDVNPTAAVVHTATLYDLLSPPGGPLAGLPTAVYVHGFDITWSPFRRFPIPYKNYANTATYQRRLIDYADHVMYIANSDFSRQRLIRAGFPANRIAVCYLPVVPKFPMKATNGVAGRADVLYLGRFVECKGPAEVVKAVALARECGADVRLTMIGDGPLFASVQRLVEEKRLSDSVRLLGSVPNPEAIERLAKSDALIMHNQTDSRSGQQEAFGYAHAEALAHGIPVLTGADGGPTEFLVDGHNGLLVEPGDVEAQAEQLQNLAYDETLHSALRVGASETATRLFSATTHREKVLAAVQRVNA